MQGGNMYKSSEQYEKHIRHGLIIIIQLWVTLQEVQNNLQNTEEWVSNKQLHPLQQFPKYHLKDDVLRNPEAIGNGAGSWK